MIAPFLSPQVCRFYATHDRMNSRKARGVNEKTPILIDRRRSDAGPLFRCGCTVDSSPAHRQGILETQHRILRARWPVRSDNLLSNENWFQYVIPELNQTAKQ